MDIFNNILSVINTVIIVVVSVAFIFQLIYLFLFWLKPRKYPKTKNKHYIGIFILAKDEGEVIKRTLTYLTQLNYPHDKYEIILLADNCSDDTASIAKNIQADIKIRVIERFEDDKKKQNVGYACQFLFDTLKPELDKYDFFIRFDADNIVDKDYLNYMNDAYESGVKIAKGYNNAYNLSQNVISGVSGLWYIRDSRFNCHARAALHTDVFLVGGGMMFASSIIKESGWNALSNSEDIEFTIMNMKKKHKISYVPDAILYEDQPSTLKALFKRNMRMGKSLHKLFYKEGFKCLGRFFISFKYKYLDMFLNLLFIPIAMLCVFWFPPYYIYQIVYHLIISNYEVVNQTLILIGLILLFAFLLPFILQAFLVVALDHKKIKVPVKKLIGTCFAFPLFMIIYALGIVFGVISFKSSWKHIDRNDYSNSEEFKTILKDNNYIG